MYPMNFRPHRQRKNQAVKMITKKNKNQYFVTIKYPEPPTYQSLGKMVHTIDKNQDKNTIKKK